jgi:predicted PurR-regulated permease PerM
VTDTEFDRRLLRTIATVVAAVVVLFALWQARDALILIYVSGLVAMGFSPLVRLIERPRKHHKGRGLPRILAILSIYLSAIAVLVLLGLVIVPPLVDQATALWQQLPEQFVSVERALIRYKLMTRAITWQEAVQQAPAGSGQNAVSAILAAAWRLVGGLFGVVTIVILSFYLLMEGESLMVYASRFLPEEQRGPMSNAARESVAKVSAWLRGQATLAGVMGTAVAVGLGVLGVPYFYVLALVAAVGETIPVLGPLISAVMATAVSLTVSPRLALMVGIYVVFLHQLEVNVLVPKIMERRVGLTPVGVMVALLVGASLYGLTGAILAIPTAAILSVLVDQFATR